MSYLKNHKLLLLIISVLLLANISLLWFYVWRKPEPPSKPAFENPRTMMIREVGLTDDQVTVYDSIRNNHYESIRPMFDELRSSRDSLFKLINRPTVDDSLIAAYSERVFEKQQAIDLKIHRYFRTIRDLCTDEQKPKLDSLLQTIAKRMSSGNRKRSHGEQKSKK